MGFLNKDWCNLKWSDWAKFDPSPKNFSFMGYVQGVYKVRPTDGEILAYIGQTTELRKRLRTLRRHTLKDDMPFSDPHVAASALWAWKDAEGMSFECSVAETNCPSTDFREGLESYLLWQYRLEKNESTLCNFGRFHLDYMRPSSRDKGRRGYKLPEGMKNVRVNGPSLPPLKLFGTHTGSDWMELEWSEPQLLARKETSKTPMTPGVYKIMNYSNGELVYIGESINIRNRLSNHAPKIDGNTMIYFSYHALPESILEFQLHELENDLIGAYYESTKKIPEYQFSNAEKWIFK